MSNTKGSRGRVAPEIEVATDDAAQNDEETGADAPAAAAVADAGEVEPFAGFEGDNPHDDEDQVEIDVDLQKQIEDDMRLVPIIPRKTLMRTRIGTKPDGSPAWYNFIEGKEVFVPNHVAKWLKEQGAV